MFLQGRGFAMFLNRGLIRVTKRGVKFFLSCSEILEALLIQTVIGNNWLDLSLFPVAGDETREKK